MKYLIFRLQDKADGNFLLECDNLAREDTTEKETATAKLIEESIQFLLHSLDKDKIIKINYSKVIE